VLIWIPLLLFGLCLPSPLAFLFFSSRLPSHRNLQNFVKNSIVGISILCILYLLRFSLTVYYSTANTVVMQTVYILMMTTMACLVASVGTQVWQVFQSAHLREKKLFVLIGMITLIMLEGFAWFFCSRN